MTHRLEIFSLIQFFKNQVIKHTVLSVIEIGPFTLGDFLKLRCVSTRGRPSPNVTWWRDNAFLMDGTFQLLDGAAKDDEKVVINDLEIRNLERHHNGAILTCRAVNNIMAPAAVVSVKILMHCKYIHQYYIK